MFKEKIQIINMINIKNTPSRPPPPKKIKTKVKTKVKGLLREVQNFPKGSTAFNLWNLFNVLNIMDKMDSKIA